MVRRVPIPLLVLRSEAAQGSAGRYRRVLVPLDGTTESETVLEVAEQIAGASGVSHTLLRVVPALHPVLRAIAPDAAVAREIGADLVALATHGRGRAARLLLGSVADKVLRGAEVPVLLGHIEQPSPRRP